MDDRVTVIGGGLAGSEAAWQLARSGVDVDLYEMRPERRTQAHHTDRLAELVCSNSLGSCEQGSASALLKEEMRLLGSLIVECAWRCRVPAGAALAVDRDLFSAAVTEAVGGHQRIRVHRGELGAIPKEGVCIIATGPLTSPALVKSIHELTGHDSLHFFDAAAPIVTRESINMEIAYLKSRYDKGEGSYINCPMDRHHYLRFLEALVSAERVELKDFERDTPFFESCLPVEVIGSRGKDTLRFGPMKPVGLEDPRTGRRPYAVVQLRQDNVAASLYNMVGFQTNLKWGEQKRVFSMIPGLENCEFVRLGVMHRNTYLNSPVVLDKTLGLKSRPGVFCAGQLTGVEGYSESCATGILAAMNAVRWLRGKPLIELSPGTMLGALVRYITECDPDRFQPINSNWGIIDCPPEFEALDKRSRRNALRQRALELTASLEPCLAAR